jgi:site-specific DNA recombinase
MLEAARRSVADCDQRLAKYRAGLEAGMDPGLVAQWTAEVRAQRLRAEQRLRPPPEERRLTEAEIAQLVGSFRQPRAIASTQTVIARMSGTSWFSAIWTP